MTERELESDRAVHTSKHEAMVPDVSGDSERIEVIDLIRGLAAFSVCWFHFTQGNRGFLPDGWLRASGHLGTFGAEMFFVVSGFILPLTMYKRNYRVQHHGLAFMGKRVARLHPPFLFAVAVAWGLWYLGSLVPGFQGEPLSIGLRDVVTHFTYTTAIVGDQWAIPALWALAIEMQFYIVLALAYAGLVDRRVWIRVGVVVAFALSSLLPIGGAFLPHWSSLFGLGLATFLFLRRLVSAPVYAGLAILCVACSVYVQDWEVGLVALLTALAVAFVRLPMPKPIQWLGMISYSLYLLHIPIGGRVINLGTRLGDGMGTRLAVLAAAIVASIAAAYVAYLVIEKPAHRLARRIRYRPGAPARAVEGAEIAGPVL